MSWNSTLEYYRLINELVADRLGGLHSARIVLYSLDFEEVESAQREARWDDAARTLIKAGIALELAGAEFLVICTNTMHKVADVVASRTALPLLHIGDAVGGAITESGLCRVGLLGTRFVMEERFYRDRLQERFGIDVLVPGKKEQAMIDRIIYDELCLGKIADTSRHTCLKIIQDLIRRGAGGVILGCTELPLLIHHNDVPVPLFDTTRIHAEAAVKQALAT